VVHVAIIGAGPAGLFAAERLAGTGVRVTVFEQMPSVGRKLLMAGRGGLNLTHGEDFAAFVRRYGASEPWIASMLSRFGPSDLRAWADGLGQDTFVGSSGRIFPRAMKASPLLRAWLARLAALGVDIRPRHRWLGFDGATALRFAHAGETVVHSADATLLALGGASWPRLGSDAAWVPWLAEAGVVISPLAPSNAGVAIAWSEPLKARAVGEPLKRIAIRVGTRTVRGEAVVTAAGLEGGVIYALNPEIRAELAARGAADLSVDLRPDIAVEDLSARLAAVPAKQSTSTRLAKGAKLSAAAIAVLRDGAGGALPRDPHALASAIKSVTLHVEALSGFARAISTAGGVARDAVDARMMLIARPGTFVAGEMLDWDAPTGGYLLQATFATAACAAEGIRTWLAEQGHGAG